MVGTGINNTIIFRKPPLEYCRWGFSFQSLNRLIQLFESIRNRYVLDVNLNIYHELPYSVLRLRDGINTTEYKVHVNKYWWFRALYFVQALGV